MSKRIKINDHSRSRYFDSLYELKVILEHDYLERVVSLHLRDSNNKLLPYYHLEITSDGCVKELYGNNVSWELLSKQIQ